MNPAEMKFKNSGTADEKAKMEHTEKAMFFKIPKRTGMAISGLLILACVVVGLQTPHRESALGLMACAGFFAAVFFILAVIKPYIYRQTSAH